MDGFRYNYRDFLKDDKFIKWRLLKTEELEQYWTDFVKDNPQCNEALAKAINKFDTVTLNNYTPSDSEYETLLKNIRKDTIHRKNRIKRLRIYAAAAACIVLFIISSLFIYTGTLAVDNENEHIVGETRNSENIQFISANKSLSLSQEIEIKMNAKGNATIIDKDGKKIEDVNISNKTLNKLIVPYGKRSSITLADGTKVWLNSGTELEFPSTFNDKTRDIKIVGEIYIDVAKDKTKPFYVHTTRADIQVLGTKFNVSAYKEDVSESIVLVEGKVTVNAQNNMMSEMNPNEMLVVNSDGIKKNIVDATQYISWKDGILNFNKATLSSILHNVGRYYNVSFEKNNHIEFAQRTYSGKLILSDNLDDIMNSISALTSTVYNRENNKILIKNK